MNIHIYIYIYVYSHIHIIYMHHTRFGSQDVVLEAAQTWHYFSCVAGTCPRKSFQRLGPEHYCIIIITIGLFVLLLLLDYYIWFICTIIITIITMVLYYILYILNHITDATLAFETGCVVSSQTFKARQTDPDSRALSFDLPGFFLREIGRSSATPQKCKAPSSRNLRRYG